MRTFKSIVTSIVLLAVSQAYASSVTIPNSFTAGTPAVATQVNANFNAVKTAVDDNNTRIAMLETAIATLSATNTALNSRVAALEAKLEHVTALTVNGYPTVRFSGVNVQIISGVGATSSTPNGMGNLIIGYNEADSSGIYRCSVGGLTGTLNSTTCTAAGGVWSSAGFRTGSHNLIVGSQNNYSSYGGTVLGYRNTINFPYSSVTGGSENLASGLYSHVAAGVANNASGPYSGVTGGAYNISNGNISSITGGTNNIASGIYSSVTGGSFNTASANASSIAGGGNGVSTGGNIADTNYSSILGGVSQNTSAVGQTIPALP